MISPFAIVGLGCRLPGRHSVEVLRSRLRDAETALRVPSARSAIRPERCCDPRGDDPDKPRSMRGGYVVDAWEFDWRKFRIPPADAAVFNPMQFVALEAAADALTDVVNVPRENTAILVGASGCGFQKDSGLRIHLDEMLEALEASKSFRAVDGEVRANVLASVRRQMDRALRECSSDNAVGSLASVAAGRIAMHFDLCGAHYAIDADHASGLAAIDIGVRGLAAREWDCVVAGAVSELLTPLEVLAYERAGLLSTRDSIRPFDRETDGTLLGEGAAFVVIKRLDDALADGDRIHALLTGIGVAAEVAREDVKAPGGDALSRAIRAAWRDAPARPTYVEADGSGIPSLDAEELRAMVDAFGSAPPIASTKATFGHLRAAASAASLVRGVLALSEGAPPCITPEHPLEGYPQAIAAGTRVDRVGIDAIGSCGTCYHAVIERHDAARARSSASARDGEPRAFEPLAVAAMAGIYADADDPDALWRNLLDGKDSIRTVPSDRWSVARHVDSSGAAREKSVASQGSFVPLPASGDAKQGAIDASHRLLLRAADQLPRALLSRFAPERVATIVAHMPFQALKFASDARVNFAEFGAELAGALRDAGVHAPSARKIVSETARAFRANRPPVGATTLFGWQPSWLAARVADRFGLRGPRLAVESACASTLAALHAAAQMLHANEVDAVLVGASQCEMAVEFYVATSRFNGLSPTGIAPFDAHANGFLPGEGAGLFVLTRAKDAIASGESIRGLILGIGGSSDGKGRSVLTPSAEGEALAMQRALERAGLGPGDVSYVECHGTGTALGDAVEGLAIACTYGSAERANPLPIGSVKSNLGHLCPAAGAPALTKALYAVERGEIPPSLHCEHPNPKIDFAAGRMEVVRTRREWARTNDAPRRAAISTFGIGGSNFHVIVGEHRADSARVPETRPSLLRRTLVPAAARSELFQFVGANPAACLRDARSLADALDGCTQGEFVDAALATRGVRTARASEASRLALTATSPEDLVRKLEIAERAVTASRSVDALAGTGIFLRTMEPKSRAGLRVGLFPGQGPQYDGMLRELAASNPIVEETLARADRAWQEWTGRALRPALWPERGAAPPRDEDLHAAVFAVNMALHAALDAAGVTFDLFIGQSAGELSALVAAGALSFEDGLRAIRERTLAVLELELPDRGSMAAVSGERATFEPLLDGLADAVTVAADNAPRSRLVSGATAAMKTLAERCARHGLEWTPLAVSHAYHSRIIAGAAVRYRAALESLTWHPPRKPVLSTVDLATYDGDRAATIARLVAQYTTGVRFREAIETAYAKGARLFIESGPKWPLTGYVHDTLGERPHTAHATVHPKTGEREMFLRLLGCVFAAGHRGTTIGASDRMNEKESPGSANPAPSDTAGSNRPGTASGGEFRRVRDEVITALAERTGYPTEMLELDLDLEGDLGIDTVKQVEVFSSVRERLGLPPATGVRLRDFNTLRKVISHLAGLLGEHAPAHQSAPSPEPARAARETSGAPSPNFDRVRVAVLAALAERTGYPEEMLELDLDLEGDLGIDTVKQVEVFSRVRKEFGLPSAQGVRLRDFPTLRKVIGSLSMLLDAQGAANAAQAPRRRPVSAKHVPPPSLPPARIEPAPARANASTALAPAIPPPPRMPSERTDHPLVDRILEQRSELLRAERTFTLLADRYLYESRIAGERFVPAGIAWEALAESAMLLLGMPVVTATQLRARGPLTLDAQGARTVQLEARRASGARVTAQLFTEENGQRAIYHEAIFVMGERAAWDVPREVLRALDRRDRRRNGAAVLAAGRDAVHLGEALGGCVWAQATSFCELVGGIQIETEQLASASDARFALAPAVIECAFSLAGFAWYALSGIAGVAEQLDEVSIARDPFPGEEMLCHARLRRSGGHHAVADVTVLGADRSPVMRLRGAQLACVEDLVRRQSVDSDAPGSEALSWNRFYRALQQPGSRKGS